MPRGKKRSRKASGTAKVELTDKELKNTPRAFVIKRGNVAGQIKDLVQDFREVMSPNCPKKLKESRLNRIADYTAVAGPLSVSHLCVFSQSESSPYLRLVKLPQGPTLTFKIEEYTLAREVKAAQRKKQIGKRTFAVAPLQVMSGFSGADVEMDKASPKMILSEMLRGLFPAVDVPKFNQAECRRVALFNYHASEDVVQFRQYAIQQRPAGLDRGVSKLLRTWRPPKMGGQEDIADWIMSGGGAVSESDFDQPTEAPNTRAGGSIGVKLNEIGPRMKLKLIKVQDGVCTGAVLYHRYVTKTPSQLQVNEANAKERRKLKERNERITKLYGDSVAKKKLIEKKKAARAAENRNDDRDDDDEPPKKVKKDGPPKKGKTEEGGKKKRYNPFGNKKKKVVSNESSKGSGKGGGASDGKGQKRNADEPRKHGQHRALERFQQAQKKQKTN